MPLSELAIIERVRRLSGTCNSRHVSLGIGDDCAIVVPPPGHEILVTTDFSLEGRHFRRDWHTPESVGHRTLARGLSDLAAMGASPLAAFLSIALPADFDQKWLDRFLKGFLALAATYKVPLAGGDTAQAPDRHIVADIVLLGSGPCGRSLRRSTARIGDRIFVTGALGGSAAQLARIASGKRPVRGPHTHPEPRLKMGQLLQRRGLANACIDLSDGLSTDLTHLCRSSGVHASLDSRSIPLGSHATLAHALHGGEDYELLFTSSKRLPRTLLGTPITEIGQVKQSRARSPTILLDSQPLKPQGWEHFEAR